MKNIEYIYRKDGGRVLISNDEKINIMELLEKDYHYILDSINKSTFSIRLNECDEFRELTFNEKVVGFITYDILNRSNKLLTNIYIIEGYRRNGIFTEELKYQYSNSKTVIIYEPTKLMVETLIRLGYARKLTDSIVISAINFNMQLSDALSNSTDELPEKLKSTNLYDINICATISFKIFTKTKYTVYYTRILETDVNKCENARNNMGEEYFDNIVNTIIEDDTEIQRWLFLLRHNLPKKQVNVEEIIGKVDSLSPTLMNHIANDKITQKEAVQIQNQLQLEYRTKRVDKELLELRLNYLIENSNEKTIMTNNPEYCPYCHQEKSGLENYCVICGYKFYDLDEIDEEYYVYKEILKEKQSYKHTLTGKKQLKNYYNIEYLTNLAMCEIMMQAMEYYVDDEIFKWKARDYSIEHIDLKRIMIGGGYVTFNMNPEKWEKEGINYTNNELKSILKEYGCKVSGNKYELVQRIKNEIPLEEIQSEYMEVTIEGKEYLLENQDIIHFDAMLEDYIYDEYKEFVNNSDDEDIISNEIDFLQKHIEKAIETENHDQLIDSLRTQSQLYSHIGELSKFLENEVKILIMNLNMYYIHPHYYSYYKPVDEVSWDIMYKFRNNFTNEEVNDVINSVYSSLDKKQLKVEFYDMVEVFKDIFKHYSLTGINSKIQRKYYKKKYDRIKDSKRKKIKGFTTLDRFF